MPLLSPRIYIQPLRGASLLARRMSTTPIKHKFLVYAPDYKAEGTFEKRMSVRASHLDLAKERISGGFIRVGAAMLTPESIATPDADKKLIGSVFICEAENIEDQEKVETDPYYTAGVWDKENLVIVPVLAATPIP